MKRIATLFIFVIIASLVGCQGKEVRRDPSPSPLDVNYHAALVEGWEHIARGQAGGSYAWNQDIPDDEVVRLHSPLGGDIKLFSRQCGIDWPDYKKAGGIFEYKINELFPPLVKFCVLDVIVAWELPDGFKTEYPLRGIRGQYYFRRRPDGAKPAKMQWAPQVGLSRWFNGIAFAQFRAYSQPEVVHPIGPGAPQMKLKKQNRNEPVMLRVHLNDPAGEQGGLWKIQGCGNEVGGALAPGQRIIEIKRSALIGEKPVQGTCALFGYAVDGDTLKDDFVVVASVFGVSHVHLGGDARVEGEGDERRVFFDVGNTVTVVTYGHNEASNDLSGTFKYDPNAMGLGVFTHVGRAAYGIQVGDRIEWLQ